MKLKSLQLQGFKSFPDKTRLDFSDGITAVVGPNGSGKSNISDAVRWVLGEQSTKSLRGSKMEDVIFNGASQRKAVGYAQVSLTLDNSDRSLSFDNDEVKITRRYYRSGESDYMINNATVRLRDIHELFMDTGLGRDGYSIIGQGRISDIVSSKSADRREIFEEAAGISKFRYRKIEAEKKLNDAQENLLRLKDILQELTLQLEPLKIQSEKAKKYLVLAEDKRSIEIGLWLRIIENSKTMLREQEKRLLITQNQHNDICSQLDSLEQEMEQTRIQSQQCTAGIDKAVNDRATFDRDSADAKAQADILKNTVEHNSRNIQSIIHDIDNIEAGLFQFESNIAAKQEQQEQLILQIEQTNAQLNDIAEQLDKLTTKSESRLSKIHDLMEQKDAVKQSIRENSESTITAQSSLDRLEERITLLEHTRDQHTFRKSQFNEELGFLTQQLSDIDKDINAKQEQLDKQQQLTEQASKAAQLAHQQCDRLQLDISDAKRRIDMLNQMERELEGFNRSVKVIMKAVNSGRLSGIHGPVSRLVSTDSQYTTAIETALGQSMQNIVTQDEQSAKDAIYYLKQNDGGRATFLPISVINGNILNIPSLSRHNGFVGLAIDLVKYDKQYSNIMANLLGRIVVADNLDNAVDIAKANGYRFRIVTLDGQVVNSGGSLTGGSYSKSAGLLSRSAKIDSLKQKLTGLEASLASTKEDMQQKNEQLAAYKQEENSITAAISALQNNRIQIASNAENLQNQLDSLKHDYDKAQADIDQASVKYDELCDTLDKLEEQAVEYKIKLAQIEQSLNQTSQKQDETEKRHNELFTQRSEIMLTLMSLDKDSQLMQSEISHITEQLESQTSRLSKLQSDKLRYEQENISLDEQIKLLLQKHEQFNIKSEECDKLIYDFNQKRDILESRYQQLRNDEREKTAERETVGSELARLEEKQLTIQKEYDSTLKKLWEEYELTRAEAEKQYQPVENQQASQRTLNEINSKIKALGSVNVGAVEQYKQVSERHAFLTEQIADVEQSRDRLINLISGLTSSMKEIFTQKFTQINSNFSAIFTEMFGGGTASLSLTDPDDILNCGIDIKVKPPGKIINNIDALSGGEKALVAIVLYFAILKVNPSPFCILDEIEAALDDVNVDRYAQYLHRLCDSTQFIVITHRHGTMKQSDMLYGVTMQEQGVSKLLQLNVNEVLENNQAEDIVG